MRHHRTPGPTVLIAILSFSIFPSQALLAQDPGVVGAAVAAACQSIPDPTSHAVLSGTVTDSVSGVPLPHALVSISWSEGDTTRSSETETDLKGFFAFCDVPGNTDVLVTTTLREVGKPILVKTEPGMLHVVPVSHPFSDPSIPGTLIGRIVDADTRDPVEGATVFLWDEEVRSVDISNRWGYFSLGSHPWGIYTVRVTHLGYGTTSASVRVTGDMTESVEVEISQTPIEIEGIVVQASSRLRAWDMDGLVRRMDAGWGWFVTRDRIEKMPAGRLMDFVRDVPGVRLSHSGFSTSMTVRGKACRPQIYVDGMPWIFELDFTLKEFIADELEAVEVFRGQMEVPGEFRRSSDPCAVIAIWTRRGA